MIPARLYGEKNTGGKVEVLVERIINQRQVLAHIRASKSPKPGTQLLLENTLSAAVQDKIDALYQLTFDIQQPVLDALYQCGKIPLPPYMERDADDTDKERYQTTYAQEAGSVAAPTAGLHFDENFLQQIEAKGVHIDYVTLHVGAGTFQPVRTETIEEHTMHHEWIDVPESVCNAIQQTKHVGGRVIAVGTTVVRSLESATRLGELKPYQGETNIFIYPGFDFKVIDGLITNFHLPKSTLLMLVSAFAGTESIQHAYQQAVEKKYRFFSYGDAMLIV